MYTTKYRLTKTGKLLCFLLALILTGLIYFFVDRYLADLPPAGQLLESVPVSPDHVSAPNPADSLSSQAVLPADQKDGSPVSGESEPSLSSAPALHISIYFDPESTLVRADSQKELDRFIKAVFDADDQPVQSSSAGGLANKAPFAIVIEGNCATTLTASQITRADRDAHHALSGGRMDAVMQYLSDNGMDVSRIDFTYVDFGADNAKNDNSTFSKRIQNRRVDVYLYEYEPVS